MKTCTCTLESDIAKTQAYKRYEESYCGKQIFKIRKNLYFHALERCCQTLKSAE